MRNSRTFGIGWGVFLCCMTALPLMAQTPSKDPGPQTDTDAMDKQSKGIMEAVTQRQMRDLYHGWTTGEGIWSADEKELLRRAIAGTNNPKQDMMTLAKAGMVPRDMVQRWLQLQGELKNRLAQVSVLMEIAEENEDDESLARCRKLLARVSDITERTMKLRLAEARLKIKHDNPSLVGTASGGLMMDNPDKDEEK